MSRTPEFRPHERRQIITDIVNPINIIDPIDVTDPINIPDPITPGRILGRIILIFGVVKEGVFRHIMGGDGLPDSVVVGVGGVDGGGALGRRLDGVEGGVHIPGERKI